MPGAAAFSSLAGRGVRATLDGAVVHVGRRKLMAEAGLMGCADLGAAAERLSKKARPPCSPAGSDGCAASSRWPTP
jgi:cation transport ATPase